MVGLALRPEAANETYCIANSDAPTVLIIGSISAALGVAIVRRFAVAPRGAPSGEMLGRPRLLRNDSTLGWSIWIAGSLRHRHHGIAAGGIRFFVACSKAYANSIRRGSLHASPLKLIPYGIGLASKPAGNGGVGWLGTIPKGTITVG
jgi:hypothetical protein